MKKFVIFIVLNAASDLLLFFE